MVLRKYISHLLLRICQADGTPRRSLVSFRKDTNAFPHSHIRTFLKHIPTFKLIVSSVILRRSLDGVGSLSLLRGFFAPFFVGYTILLCGFYEINSHYSFALALICSAICFISLNISSISSSETSIMLGKSILADISDFEAISSLTFLSMASRADCGRFSS